jgi:hypothetical protein
MALTASEERVVEMAASDRLTDRRRAGDARDAAVNELSHWSGRAGQ